MLTTDFSATYSPAVYEYDYSVLVQPADGKIIAAGHTSAASGSGASNFALARYLDNGSIDTSFGTYGKVVTDFRSDTADGAYAAVLQEDGKIVAAGYSRGPSSTATSDDFGLMRYNDNGTLDTTFGTAGKVWSDFGGTDLQDIARSVTVQPDGKVVAAGFAGKRFAVARYLPNNSVTVVAPIDLYTAYIGDVHPTTITTSRIDLRWQTHYLSNARYNVYRSTDPDFVPDTATLVGSNLAAGFFSDTTVSPSTRYYYIVRTITAQGPNADTRSTSEVTAFGQAATGLTAIAVDEFAIDLSWSDNSSDEIGYVVERLDGGIWTPVQTLGPNATFAIVDGLAPQTMYQFRVTARFTAAQAASALAQAPTTGLGQMQGLVIAVHGHGGTHKSNPTKSGIKDLVNRLRAGGYRVLEAVEDDRYNPNVTWDGRGSVYETALRRLQDGDAFFAAVIGYSHGGDVARRIVNNLGDVHDSTGAQWAVVYSAYIDAIQRQPNDISFPTALRNRPFFGECNCNYHENYYQRSASFYGLRGNTLTSNPGADVELEVVTEGGGPLVDHGNIDEKSVVKDRIEAQIRWFVEG